ncbi:MAG: hypothetical protein L0241_15025 [Planctomycetia bacterium]|nr:hypothetical protein [Planctomycetia bacterium]
MPPWMTRWLAWARDNLLRRARPRAISAAIGYERTGVVKWESPVPWTADAIVVDVQMRLPLSARRKTDFTFRLPSAIFPADALRPDLDDRHRVTFRFPVPPESSHGDLIWKNRVLATLPISVLTPTTFLSGLSVLNPTVAARFGGTTVAATAFVPDRCESLMAVAALKCEHRLAALSELGLRVVFRDERSQTDHAVPILLPAAQLMRPEAVVVAVCPVSPREVGAWGVSWMAGDRTLVAQRVHAIPGERFEACVRLIDTRFAVVDNTGAVRTIKLPPSLASLSRVGPCFVLSGTDPGAAGMCRFEVRGMANGELHPVIWRDVEAVVTDSPTPFVPALFDAADLTRVNGFELRLNGRLLGIASLRPVPAATINAEGGFAPPPEFTWSAAAEDELADRLKRLMG